MDIGIAFVVDINDSMIHWCLLADIGAAFFVVMNELLTSCGYWSCILCCNE